MKFQGIARIRIGAVSGLIVVFLTTLVNLVCRQLGWLPESMDLKHMAEGMVDPHINQSFTLILGIIVHLVAGVLIGIMYVSFIKSIRPKTGMLFMLSFWLILMLAGMPLSGRGWFGLNAGIILPIGTLILHLVFGFGMGAIAGKLIKKW